jgi:predicted RNA-binding protein associated with RNAse of E/G family
LSKNIERKIIKEGKDNYLNKIHYLKENPDSFSFRINKTDLKRVLILKDLMNKKEKVPGKNIDVSKLKELKSAFEQGLITEEEFKIAKKRFLEN